MFYFFRILFRKDNEARLRKTFNYRANIHIILELRVSKIKKFHFSGNDY